MRRSAVPVNPREVLVIVTRRIGDVLLATPLMRSVKLAWPEAALDVLVFEGTEGVIAANTDVRRIIAVPERTRFARHLALLAGCWRRYDVALSLVPGDRPTLYAFVAGKWRAGLLLDTRAERWKQRLLNRWVAFDDLNTHTVVTHLALTGVIGVTPRHEVIVSWSAEDALHVERLLGSDSAPIAILHTYPKFNYKMWRSEGWIELGRWLIARGFRIVLSGGGDAAELDFVAALARRMPNGVLNLAGRLSLSASTCLVGRARLFVGPDTAMTHAAAALGVPTVALYGPSNPVKWGPWPRDHTRDASPWRRCGSQRVGSVWLLQGAAACVPCLAEGCERNIASFSDCLQQLPASKVIAAVRNLTGLAVE
jgi:heptosyltransferase-3